MQEEVSDRNFKRGWQLRLRFNLEIVTNES